jgi:hypothetical protein
MARKTLTSSDSDDDDDDDEDELAPGATKSDPSKTMSFDHIVLAAPDPARSK